MSISTICYLHAKNQGILTVQRREISKKPYFGAILSPFWPKTGQKWAKKFTEKKINAAIF